jgi:preprotein translocase subunit SecA
LTYSSNLTTTYTYFMSIKITVNNPSANPAIDTATKPDQSKVISNKRSAFNATADKFLGEKKELNKYWLRVKEVEAFDAQIAGLSDSDLKAKTQEFRTKLEGLTGKEMEKKLDELLPEAFAVVREAAFRTIGQKHYPVQLIGGMVLHQGRIAEMKTGEGKTLVSTLAVYLNALPVDNQVHVVTVNDYLARRDASWMGQIYDYLGLTVSAIQSQSQFRFQLGAESDAVSRQKRQMGKVDSLEDGEMEAKTVLDVENLVPCSRSEAYTIKDSTTNLPVDVVYGINSEFGFDYLRDHLVQTKKELSQKAGQKVAIVDEVDSILIDEARTPLIISQPSNAPSARYKQFVDIARRLTQVTDYTIEEKTKSVTLTEKGIEHAQQLLGINDLYTNAENHNLVFHLDVALVALTCYKREVEYVVKGDEIIIVDVSTGRMLSGRRYSNGIHQALEAKEGIAIKEESHTAASITYQNYFRLYAKLAGMTGTASTESEELFKTYKLLVVTIPTHRPVVRKDYVDKIFKSESGKFTAVVADIKDINATGQPILVGTASIEKNQVLSALLSAQNIDHKVLNAKNHEQEARIISEAGKIGSITIATNIAGRGVDIKLGGEKPEDDGQVSKWRAEREAVKNLGGLFVIGTEKHESRRIDNQLRGRSGRQGDQGMSQFYLALNDELIRKFGGDNAKLWQALPIPDDQAIQMPAMNSMITQAQKKIESYNYDSRKHIMEHDDVINKQRSVVYKKRMKILKNQDFNYIDEIQKTITRTVGHILEPVASLNLRKLAKDSSLVNPMVKNLNSIKPMDIYNKENLAKLIIDEKRNLKTLVPKISKAIYDELETGWKIYNENTKQGMTRYIFLRALDTLWTEHLVLIDNLEDTVRFSQYSQKTPLAEYKREGMRVFILLLEEIDKEVSSTLFKVSPDFVNPEMLE